MCEIGGGSCYCNAEVSGYEYIFPSSITESRNESENDDVVGLYRSSCVVVLGDGIFYSFFDSDDGDEKVCSG